VLRLHVHNELCSCPVAEQAKSTSRKLGNRATRVCCVGLLVKAWCAVSFGWLMLGEGRRVTTARRARYLGPMPKSAGAA